jgi:hypothetical protein
MRKLCRRDGLFTTVVVRIQCPNYSSLDFGAVALPVCFLQSEKVRVVDGKYGRALSKQAVSVEFLYEKSTNGSPPLHLETDSSGEAQFSIPEPTPAHLNGTVALTSERWHCACWMMADTETVVHKGVVQTAPPKT